MTVRKDRDREGWLVQVEVDGQRRRKTFHGDKREAQRYERMIRNNLEKSRPYLALSAALRAYEATLRTRGKRSTVAWATCFGGHLEAHFGATYNLAEVRQADVDAFVAAERRRGLADTSINGALRVLIAAGRLAWREGKLEQPPHVRRLREQRKLPSVLSPAEVRKLVEAADPVAALAIQIAAHAGLRHQEILHLTWADVVLGPEPALLVRGKDGWSPKTHTERAVPMNATLVRALAAHPDALSGSRWLFPHPHDPGRPVRNLFGPVGRAFKAAGLDDPDGKPGLHKLRKTYASTLLAKGVDLKTIQELGGWESAQVLERSYLRSNMDLKKRAVALLED